MEYDLKLELYRQMVRIRILEESILNLFSEGKISGTTHTYTGQEAIASASLAHRHSNGAVFSNHRCHGHYVSYGGSVQALLSEIIGTEDGVCGGRGGSQHLCLEHFFTNGIQGGMLPIAAGYALANKLKNENDITIAFIGDGTWGEGVVYETLNMVSLWDIPLLLIVEDNAYAQTTPSHIGRAGSILDRVRSFNIQCSELESNDVIELYDTFSEAFGYVRNKRRPFCQIVRTYRLGPHSKGDDYRAKEEIELWRKKDPLVVSRKYINDEDACRILEEEKESMKVCVEKALQGKSENIEHLGVGITHSYKDRNSQHNIPILEASGKFVDSINSALHIVLDNNKNAVILGEDISDPYGGAFKVTKGLSTKFPNQVITTPISEAGIAGIANGLALNKYRPIVEVMFGDFVTLMYDQIINHGAKFKWIYNNRVNTPVLIRTPAGGKRGYGPTHSQSLEKCFFGIPNVLVIAPTQYHNPGQLLLNIFDVMETPVIFVESKALYVEKLIVENNGMAGSFNIKSTDSLLPTIRLTPDTELAKASIICYGEGIIQALEASWQMMLDEEINVEIICPSLISPLPIEDINTLISSDSDYILILDENVSTFGWSAEVALNIRENSEKSGIARDVERLGMHEFFISSSKQTENMTYPTKSDIIKRIKNHFNLHI